MTLKIVPGMQLPLDAVDSRAYDDLPASLSLLDEISRRQEFRHLDAVQRIAAEFPLLESAEVEYCELNVEAILASSLSQKDKRALILNFVEAPCGVLLYPLPKLIVTDALDQMPDERRDIALRHELVHLEQLIRGDTWYSEQEGQFWNGEWHPVEDINAGRVQGDPAAVVAYLRLPWEREAYCRTEGEEAYQLMLQAALCRHVVVQTLGAIGQDTDAVELTLAVRSMIHDAVAGASSLEDTALEELGVVVDAVGKLEYKISGGAAASLWQEVISLLDGDLWLEEEWHPDNQVLINLVRAGMVRVEQSTA